MNITSAVEANLKISEKGMKPNEAQKSARRRGQKNGSMQSLSSLLPVHSTSVPESPCGSSCQYTPTTMPQTQFTWNDCVYSSTPLPCQPPLTPTPTMQSTWNGSALSSQAHLTQTPTVQSSCNNPLSSNVPLSNTSTWQTHLISTPTMQSIASWNDAGMLSASRPILPTGFQYSGILECRPIHIHYASFLMLPKSIMDVGKILRRNIGTVPQI